IATQRQPIASARGLYARYASDAIQQVLEESANLFRLRVPGTRQRNSNGQNTVRPESWIDLLKSDETLDQQTCACQQAQRQRHFSDHEQFAQPLVATADRGTAAAFFQRFVRPCLGDLKSGNNPEHNPGQDRYDDSED